MSGFSKLFEPVKVGGLTLKNRATMAPMYVGYANPDGSVSPLVLDHYGEMAASGAAMIVVENAAVDPVGMGSPWTIRADEDAYIDGLKQIAGRIKENGALAFQQINHTGRYAFVPEKVAPSAIDLGAGVPKEISADEIDALVQAYADAAVRVKEAGFDGVEIHGGTGYLLVQFLSPITNVRTDEYGGSLENRMRFPLRVVDAVLEQVGPDFPVGYRFLADELLPGGLKTEEAVVFAAELEKRGLAYLSVMAGIYDSMFLPEFQAMEKEEGYMASFAEAVKKACPNIPVIAAGRIQSPETAEKILASGQADMVGLARVLFADPLWVKKAEEGKAEEIVSCEPTCMLCMKRIMSGKPAFCSQWTKERRDNFLIGLGEKPEETEQI